MFTLGTKESKDLLWVRFKWISTSSQWVSNLSRKIEYRNVIWRYRNKAKISLQRNTAAALGYISIKLQSFHWKRHSAESWYLERTLTAFKSQNMIKLSLGTETVYCYIHTLMGLNFNSESWFLGKSAKILASRHYGS